MSQEEVIAMLASLGVAPGQKRPRCWNGFLDVFQRFAERVAANTRESIANEFDRRAKPMSGWYEPEDPARIVRAVGGKP